jgi:uncharacterized protein YvpB
MAVLVSRLVAAVLVTLAILSTPRGSSADSGVLLSGFPLLKQQHMLTCEASAASMGTKAALTEAQIMARMPRSANPNLGFRGNLDGLPDPKLWNYGVYAGPVRKVLSSYGYTSVLLQNATNADVKTYIRKGWPVMLWLTYALKPAVPRLGMAGGRPFVLVPHEHAILALGYDANTVIANDPWLPKIVRYRWSDFDHSWALFGNMALAIDPCPAPGPVGGLTLQAASTHRLLWTWSPAKNAVQYHVTVQLKKAATPTVFDGAVSSPTYTLLSPTRGATYRILVRSVSACGELSNTREMLVSVPVLTPPTATPTPTPAGPTATPQPTALATAQHA